MEANLRLGGDDVRERESQAAGWPWVWYALLIGLVIWGFSLALNPSRGGDLRIYLVASERFLHALPLFPDSDGPIAFKYFPAVAWFFVPLLAFPQKLAVIAWNVSSILGLALSAHLLKKPLERDWEGGVPARAFVLATAAVIQPVFLELFYGQVNLWMMTLLVLSLVVAEHRRFAAAGLAMATAILLKPTAILVLFYFLVRKLRPVVAFSVLWTLVLCLPFLARYGWTGSLQEIRAWLAMLHQTVAAWILGPNPQGLPTLLLSLFYPPNSQPPAIALVTVSLVAMVAAAVVPIAARVKPVALFASFCFGASFVSPIAWRANFVLAWPLLSMVAMTDKGRAREIGGWILGVLAAISLLFSDWILGQRRFEAVMYLRPFGIAFAALFAWAMATLPRSSKR